MRRILLSFGMLACWISLHGQCGALSPTTLPFSEGFESFSGTVEPSANDSNFYCSSTYRWDFYRGGTYGRLSFGQDAHLGSQSAVMDVSTDSHYDTNYTTLTVNLTAYTSTTNDIVLSFYYKDKGDEADPEDMVWARGSDTDSWIQILDWNAEANGSNWTLGRFKLDSILTANSQSFSATTQIRWGQMDNFTWGSDGFAFDDVSIVEVICPQPTALSYSNATPTSLDLNWTTGGATAWQVSYDTTGHPVGANLANITSTPPYSISGLSGGITYDFYVRDSCGNGNVSFWTGPLSVTMPCGTYTAPYSNNFDNETTSSLPTCWSTYNTTSYGSVNVSAIGTPNGAKHLRFYNGSGTAGDTLIAITPQFTDMTAGDKQLRFNAKVSDIVNPLIVGTTNSPTGGGTITGLDTIYFTTDDVFQEVIIPLTTANGYNGTDQYVVLGHGMGGTYDYVYVDDFNYEAIPPCPKPIGISFSGITDSSVTVSFNDRGNASGSYQYQFGPVGFSQASATTHTASSNPFTVNGLYANFTYEFYLKNDCGTNGNSSWSGPYLFTTDCGEYAAPYFNDFDSEDLNELPDCWSSYSTYSYAYAQADDYKTPYSGNQELLLYNSYTNATDDTVMAISPALKNLTAGDRQIRFQASTSDVVSGLVVGTVPDPSGTSTFTPLDTITFASANTYAEYIVPVTAANGYNGTDKYIAIQHTLGSTYDYISIDDFYYEVQPSCLPTLATDVNILAVKKDSVFLNWTPGDGGKFRLEIGPAGFTPGSGSYLVSTTDTFAGFGSLSPVTNYDIYIQDSCNYGLSPLQGPVSFTTNCDVAVAPILEDFDDWGTDSISYCWTEASSSFYKWEVENGGTSSSNTGPNADYSGTGNYVYTEASSGSAGDTARLMTMRVDVSGLTNVEVAFFYHMYGGDIGSLFLEINDGTQTFSGLGAISGQQQTAHTDPYLPFAFNAAALSLNSDTITVSICGIRGGGYEGDIAIDNFEVREATTCPTPASFSVSSVTTNSAVVSWLSGSGNSNINWGPAGFSQGSGAGNFVLGTTSPTTLSGLTPNTAYDVYVQDSCTMVPNGVWLGPITFRTPCTSALAGGTYTIGHSASADFQSFDSLSNVLSYCGITGPVVFNIQPGTYTDRLHLHSVPGVSSVNTITFNGSGSDTLMWDQVGPQATVLIDSVKKVTLHNMRIENNTGAEAWGVLLMNNSDSVVIDSCSIIVDNGSSSGDISPVLISDDTENDLGEGAEVDYLTLNGCELIGGYYGLALEGNGTNDFGKGHVITDNHISDFYSGGIHGDDLEDLLISGNTIESSRGSADGIYLTQPYKFRVEANTIHVDDYGIYVLDGNDGKSVAANSTLINNMVWSTGDYGVYLNDVEKVSVYHNTSMGEPALKLNDQDTVDIRNNIFASASDYAFESSDSIMPVEVMDYNLFYRVDGGNVMYVDYNSYADLASFQAAYPALNVHSVEGDPLFLSPTDLHVKGTRANEAGDNSVSVLVDIDGDSRPGSGATTVDIGADEFVPTANDLMMVDIISPENYDCGDSSTVVSVVIKNLGAQSQSGFDVKANISGATTTTISTTYSGTLASLTTDTVAIPAFNSIMGGNYVIQAYTQLTNDAFTNNDTVVTTLQIENAAAPMPTAAVGSFCGSGGFDTLYFPANANERMIWKSATGDTLSYADSLVVGPLGNSDTTFYLATIPPHNLHIGAMDTTIGTGMMYTSSSPGLKFDVYHAITIDSVAVYPEGAGSVTVNVEDASGNQLYTTTVSVPASAANTKTNIYLGFTIQPGTDYEINASGSTADLYRNDSGASFPYTLPGKMSITNGTLSGYYYFFYDWTVSLLGCPRADGEITIHSGSGVVNAAFSSSNGAATATNLAVSFDASATTGASSYSWDFGDGSAQGSGVTTTHTYTANGSYAVTLVASDSCTTPTRDTLVDTIVVEGINLYENALQRSLQVYPNPSSGVLKVDFASGDAHSATIRLLDLSGREIMQINAANLNGSYSSEIDLSGLADGVYMLNISAGELHATQRVIKQ